MELASFSNPAKSLFFKLIRKLRKIGSPKKQIAVRQSDEGFDIETFPWQSCFWARKLELDGDLEIKK